MSKFNVEARVIPAQLDFLTIYNTSLSKSEDDLKEQILFYYSRSGLQQRGNNDDHRHNAADAENIQNERVRQIGLAQGMVSFAKTFSTQSNVDTIETEKSRIVLYELETNWWILASIDLTRLPSAKISQDSSTKSGQEYSAREVSSAQLLLVQLIRANSLFLLHHASRLSGLFDRVGRDTCCTLLERFWNRFVRDWDVLLHGNPAANIYNATKLSGGGELGIGVGEEEWGSGEREVLEDFIDRTEGLRDLVVGRYGIPPEIDRDINTTNSNPGLTTWLGTGNDPVASDGIIFSGKGLVSKQSFRTISQWMEEIFKHGEDAYGIGENPSAPRRSRPRRKKLLRTTSDELSQDTPGQAVHPKLKSPRRRAPNLRKQAIENNASPPGIPAPLVGQVERSLDKAIAKAAARTPSGSPKQEKTQAQAMSSNSSEDSSTSTTDSVMKFFTLGYGTSWTLNPKGLKSNNSTTPDNSSRNDNNVAKSTGANGNVSTEQGLQEIDPTPEVSEDEEPDFKQKLEQSIGKFLIGLSGDLEQTELDGDGEDGTLNTSDQRIFLRTLTIEIQPRNVQRNTTIRKNSIQSIRSANSKESAEHKTIAAASVDGSTLNTTHEKVQVAVYVHQPFIFVFLFSLHTPSLTIPAFYRRIHNQLGPLQKPLLRSTDVSRVAERIAEAVGEKSSTSTPSGPQQVISPIYDLTYDPAKMTIRTSIPNIPIPGSLAAEGLTTKTTSSLSISGSWYTLGIPIGNSPHASTTSSQDNLVKSAWSRTEALNVHTQILNTHATTRSPGELEHTAKTARGWWILWMKMSDTGKSSNQVKPHESSNDNKERLGERMGTTGRATYKEAFLVRRAADYRPNLSAQPQTLSSGPGRWLLREQKRESSGASAGSGPGGVASAKGVSEGVGVDAKKWVEGLLTLTR